MDTHRFQLVSSEHHGAPEARWTRNILVTKPTRLAMITDTTSVDLASCPLGPDRPPKTANTFASPRRDNLSSRPRGVAPANTASLRSDHSANPPTPAIAASLRSDHSANPPTPAIAASLRSGHSANPPTPADQPRERGAVAASIIILPIVILAVFLAIHFAMVLHGRNVAAAAAQDGLRAAQLDGASAGNGQAAASRTLALYPNIQAAQISVDRGTSTVHITISGEVRTPLSGLFNSFEVSLEGPVERFYVESERQ